MIWPVHIDAHVIKLRDRKIVSLPPMIRTVIRIPHTSIIAGDNVVGVFGIDPRIMKIAVRTAGDAAETLTAIGAHDKRPVRFVYFVFILGIDNEICKVEWSPYHSLTSVKRLPCQPSV